MGRASIDEWKSSSSSSSRLSNSNLKGGTQCLTCKTKYEVATCQALPSSVTLTLGDDFDILHLSSQRIDILADFIHLPQQRRTSNRRSSIAELLQIHWLYPIFLDDQEPYCSSDEDEFYPVGWSSNLRWCVNGRPLRRAMVLHRASRCSRIRFAVIGTEESDRTHLSCTGDVVREMLLIPEMVQRDVSSNFATAADLIALLNLTNRTESMLWKTQIHTRLNV